MHRSLLTWTATGLAVAAAGLAAEPMFTVPSETERVAAIGETTDLPAPLRRAFEPTDAFQPIDPPGPHDWLAHHAERGQTFDAYVRSRPTRPTDKRRVICIQPLETFADDAPSLRALAAYTEAFFALPVRIQPAADLSRVTVTARTNPHTGRRQLLTTDLLTWLGRDLPDDACCRLGVTMTDLYPDPTWNFVFGQASLRRRVGVYSFARYDPAFYGVSADDTQRRAVAFRRSCKVLAHETGHMFGLAHCIHYNCLMNGSNHMDEADARPMHLCPVCLRKLHDAIGFDPAERYARLLEQSKAHGWTDEAAWLAGRIAHVKGP